MGLADIIVSGLNPLPERLLAIDFLQSIISINGGIFFKNDLLIEGVDFGVYKYPFDEKTWLAFILSSLLITISIMILGKNLDQNKFSLTYAIKAFIISLKANLGKDSFSSLHIELESYRIIVFFTLLFGNILWLSYNGSLLSGLITHKVTTPFNDLESFAKSSYRFLMSYSYSPILFLIGELQGCTANTPVF